MDKLIANLLRNGIFLFLEQDSLKVKYNGNSMSDELLKEIKENKNELLEYLRKEKVTSDYQDIVPLESPGPYELSSAQRRLWILSQIKESSLAYVIKVSIGLDQDINIAAFQRAIDSTIDRHEILRTIFKEDETGEVKQWVLRREELGFKIDYQDFRNVKNKQDEIQIYIDNKYSNEAFDLEKGPLLRASLLQVENESYIFYFNMHHIISDGWSMQVLSKDIFSHYNAYKENREPELKELAIQYKDYSAWQQAKLEEKSFASHSAYWLDKLSGELPLLDLPSKKQRPKMKTYIGRGLGTYIDPALTNKLKKYSQDNGGSLFISLLATWNVLMHKYTSQNDIIIGTPVAGRGHADLDEQIGCYVNTLALRNKINPGESFNDFYKELKNNTLKSYNHQVYPFDKLVEELDIKGDTSRTVIFDVMLMLQNSTSKTEGIEQAIVGSDSEESGMITDHGYSTLNFDLLIDVIEMENSLSLKLVYNPDVYDEDMIKGLIKHYKQFLQVVLDNPGKKIGLVNYLSKEEMHELLFTFNNTEIAYPDTKTIAELFQAQAVKTPDSIALVVGDKELSYHKLDKLSNQLAHHIQKNYTIQPDDLIGIQLNKNEWMIISILGILKAGGAYVPIDPEYPSSRKEHIVKDSSLKLLITEANFIHDIDYYDGEIFAIDVEFEAEGYDPGPLTSSATPANLAYVMYTSGSTGKPKGVMIEQRSVVRLVKNTTVYSFSPSDNLLSSGAVSFDATTFEYWGPLLNGGKLVLCPQKTLLDSKLLIREIESRAINIMWFTSGWLNQLVESEIAIFGKLKTIVAGGDRLSPGHIDKLRKKFPELQIINGYGPTENTTFSTTYTISEVEGAIPIGYPISNTRLYILNSEEQLQPVGLTGEIYLGGAGLARGYLNQPDLTKEKFIKNPFKEGERLYKTGDLGRWTKNGEIEFLGRRDEQVKIRGYRIETGEIEHVLRRHKDIETAIVIAKENERGDKELVAYITAKSEQNTNELRNYLKTVLPEYMLPSYYFQLETLPLTSNGKVDKKALPDHGVLGLNSGTEYVAPRNEIEEKLVKIWEEVLKRENIGVKDDFFDLGGHSLKIIKVINQVNQQFGLKYDLKGVYTEPTIEAMAQQIKTDLWFMESANENEYNEIKI